MKTVAVIGAGASGMMAAVAAGRADASVTIFEHTSKAGAKLLLTGGGRCNFTHDCQARDVVAALGRRGKFLGHALAAMDPAGTRSFFAEAGVQSVVEEDGRVVPVSHRAVDIRRALCEQLDLCHVRTVTHAIVREVRPTDAGFDFVLADREQHFDAVIVATGGCSYAETGSDGSGFDLARRLGHKVIHPVPAEVPLITEGLDLDRLQGLTALNVDVSIKGEKGVRRRGNVLFTHFGVSGPAILDISADASERIALGKQVKLLLDFVPHLDVAELEQIWDAAPRKINPVLELVPKRLATLLAEQIGGDNGKAGMQKAIEALKKFPVRITKTRGFDAAMVTRGGVELSEVDAATMQSKLIPGLYFAGEVLDLDGPMGGFNLQTAWSTGFLAGTCAAGMSPG